jgi:hypothetical protein
MSINFTPASTSYSLLGIQMAKANFIDQERKTIEKRETLTFGFIFFTIVLSWGGDVISDEHISHDHFSW